MTLCVQLLKLLEVPVKILQDALKESNHAPEAILCCSLKTTFNLCTWTCCAWERLCVGGVRRKEKAKKRGTTCKKGLFPFFPCKHATNSPQRLSACKTVSKSFAEHLC